MPNRVDWLLGRGLSIACGLGWIVPTAWGNIPRLQKIEHIRDALRQEMAAASVNCSAINQLLKLLAHHSGSGWQHQFVTTNWDYLLQRELRQFVQRGNLNSEPAMKPSWLAKSHVYHLNGTVELRHDESNSSPFLLEEDPACQRCFTLEANCAYNSMIWNKTFVVVGMSFECETDKFLLNRLGHVQDDLPIGESLWLVVNPDSAAVNLSCSRISSVLPQAKVVGIARGFQAWIDDGLPELQCHGALAF